MNKPVEEDTFLRVLTRRVALGTALCLGVGIEIPRILNSSDHLHSVLDHSLAVRGQF